MALGTLLFTPGKRANWGIGQMHAGMKDTVSP